MQVSFGHRDSGTALSLAPAMLSVCHYVYFLLGDPKILFPKTRASFWVGISFRLTDNPNRVSRECGRREERGSRRYPLLPEDEGRKGTPPSGSPEDTLCPGNPSMNAVEASLSGVGGEEGQVCWELLV